METTIPIRWGTVFTIVVAVPLFVTFPAWWGIGLYGQDTSHAVANLLPPAKGEALTLTPNDMPDISCSVVQWKDDPGTPTPGSSLRTYPCRPAGSLHRSRP
jgi:hypothetical protein